MTYICNNETYCQSPDSFESVEDFRQMCRAAFGEEPNIHQVGELWYDEDDNLVLEPFVGPVDLTNKLTKHGEGRVSYEDYVVYSDGTFIHAVTANDWYKAQQWFGDYQSWCDSTEAVSDPVLCSRIAQLVGLPHIHAGDGCDTRCPAYDPETAPRFAVVYDPIDWKTIAGVGITLAEAKDRAAVWLDELDEAEGDDAPCFEAFDLTETARAWFANHDGEPARWSRVEGKLHVEIDCEEQ